MRSRFFKKLALFNNLVTGIKTNKIPLDFRIFLFLLTLVLTVILGVVVILFITGIFTAGLTENEQLLENELLDVAQEISKQYEDLSIQALDFSKHLSTSIEGKAELLGISLADLSEHPELLEEIIANELELTTFALQRSKSSGAFFILNATINPRLKNAENSKAGLYLKNMEPNIISSSSPHIITLRGIPSISRNNSLCLHTEWQMEFEVSDAPYYHLPIQAAITHSNASLSRLYYWSPVITLPNTSEKIMLCAVPLIDSQGNVFGVCGLEVSAMLFKLSHIPNNPTYHRLFSLLAPINDNMLPLDKAMFAGSYAARLSSQNNDKLKITQNHHFFYSYKFTSGDAYIGIHSPINLYPQESVFYDEPWVVALMLPEDDMVNSIIKLNILLIFWLMMLVVFGMVVAFILSRKFSRPIMESFDIIKSSDLSEVPRTKIPEINDLIDFLAAHNEELHEKAKQNNLSLSMLDAFLANTRTLSPAERSVFDLYAKGHNAKESADLLFLSINTIKTHTKHIYAKLNVSSREELQLYIKMLQELGTDF